MHPGKARQWPLNSITVASLDVGGRFSSLVVLVEVLVVVVVPVPFSYLSVSSLVSVRPFGWIPTTP